MAWDNKITVRVSSSRGNTYTIGSGTMAADLNAMGFNASGADASNVGSQITASLLITQGAVAAQTQKFYGALYEEIFTATNFTNLWSLVDSSKLLAKIKEVVPANKLSGLTTLTLTAVSPGPKPK